MKFTLPTACLLGLFAAPAWSQTAAPPGNACETEVTQAVQRDRPGASQLQFVGTKRQLAPIADSETGIKGEGRYRSRSGATVAFTYSCVFDTGSGKASGVVFSDRGAAGAAPAALTPAAPSPDGRSAQNLGVAEACETAVTLSLQRKHPRVARIVFGSDSRRIGPAPNARNTVEGDGAIERAPGMNAVPFSYRCAYDTRSAKVESVQTSE